MLAQLGEFAAVPRCARSAPGRARLPASCRDGSLLVIWSSRVPRPTTLPPSIPPHLDSSRGFTIIIWGANLDLLPGRQWLFFVLNNRSGMNFGASWGLTPLLPGCSLEWGVLHGPFASRAPHPLPREEREEGRSVYAPSDLPRNWKRQSGRRRRRWWKPWCGRSRR